MKKALLLFLPALIVIYAFRWHSSHVVTGKVTDDKGLSLANVLVQEKTGSTSTLSDINGEFRMTLDKGTETLLFSKSGYESQEQNVNSMFTISIRMKPSAEVPPVADSSKISMNARANLTSANNQLQGVVPGITVRNGSPVRSRREKLTAATVDAGDGYISFEQVGRQQSNYYSAGTEFNTEDYDFINENKFLAVTDNPLSTFSIDVDAASYSNVRRYINSGQLPPAGAVRIEEMVNYFHYDYEQPKNEDPFAVHTELSSCPWNSAHELLLIGLQGKKIPTDNLPASNLVFLLDVSGSMQSENKLPLVKSSLKLLVDQLREKDHVSIVVYAGAAGLVLPPTSGSSKTQIKDAIDRLEAGGSTAGGAGIRLAYQTARRYFSEDGNNRVILCTDGDFNVGESSDDAMERLIEKERETGIFLTVLGYGMGNYKDNKMQKLADKGNGNHAYIDTESEAKKVLVSEFGGTLFTIAKDVKLQLEFNPQYVKGYRLIGYENRMLAKEDFNDDKKDAGEMGSGHTVTALYELIPAGVAEDGLIKNVDDLKYQPKAKAVAVANNELLTVKLRYKAANGNTSKLLSHVVQSKPIDLSSVSNNFRFAASVAQFGMLLRNSAFKGSANYKSVMELAKSGIGNDVEGYRKEFLGLVRSVEGMQLEDVGRR